MNRLIIIGNGFDLAHGKKTDYKSFIFWYIKKCLVEAFNNPNGSYKDDLLFVNTLLPNARFEGFGNGIKDIESYIDIMSPDKILVPEFVDNGYNSLKVFETQIKSHLFNKLIINCFDKNWVDIENEYYSILVDFARIAGKQGSSQYSILGDLKKLNSDLGLIIKELENYLIEINNDEIIDEYFEIFDPKNQTATFTHVLNFNYTNTPEKYFTSQKKNQNGGWISFNHNYIHGKIEDKTNRLIFGFGDEFDKEYVNLEELKINEFFTFVKSFWYLKTPNYQNLAEFLKGGEYQIYILGHSCGLSDRTLLNMVFEHPFCTKIKIFYHGEKEGSNNYTDLTHNISRHFKDKASMRLKIVNFQDSQPMPQFRSKVEK